MDIHTLEMPALLQSWMHGMNVFGTALYYIIYISTVTTILQYCTVILLYISTVTTILQYCIFILLYISNVTSITLVGSAIDRW